MKFVQESYGRELHRELTSVLCDGARDVNVALAGAGVHWTCTITRGDRRCSVHCFDVKGAEYLTGFEHQQEQRAMGRTSSMADTVAAVRNWIAGHEVVQMHKQFGFIDQQKRSLESIAAKAIIVCPDLAQTERELLNTACDLHELWIRHGDRSCRIYFYGKNIHPEAIFHWDECRLFAFQAADLEQLALILKLWVCDRVTPSQLQKNFPWIEMGKAARYYEEGRGIEGEFIESWDRIEKFYADMNFPPAAAIRSLVATIRKRGYDRTLRAGQSMYTLVLSRSRRHGLKQGQAHMAFHFRENGMEIKLQTEGETSIELPAIALTEEVATLLKRLEATPIN